MIIKRHIKHDTCVNFYLEGKLVCKATSTWMDTMIQDLLLKEGYKVETYE